MHVPNVQTIRGTFTFGTVPDPIGQAHDDRFDEVGHGCEMRALVRHTRSLEGAGTGSVTAPRATLNGWEGGYAVGNGKLLNRSSETLGTARLLL